MTTQPRAVVEVAAETGNAGLEVTHLGEGRYGATHARIEIGLRPSPVGAQEAVGAVVRHRQRPNLGDPEQALELPERRKDRPVDRPDLGEVLVHEPEAGRVGIPREQDDAVAGDAGQLGEPAGAIGPVVHGQHGQRRGEGGVAEWQVRGRGLHDGRAAGAALGDHRRRGLDGDGRAVGGLVGAGAGADVHDRVRHAQSLRDGGGHPRIGPAIGVVALPDLVVELRHCGASRPPPPRCSAGSGAP